MQEANPTSIKRIALLTDGIHPLVTGGMQKHSFYLAKYFAANGIEVDLYHCFHGEAPESNWLAIFTAKEQRYINSILLPFPKHAALPGHYLRESMAYSKAIKASFLQNGLPDVVYVQGLAGWALLKAGAKNKLNSTLPPIIVNPHGLEMFQTPVGWKDKLQKSMLKPAFLYNLQKADQVVALGSNLHDYLLKLGISESRILDLPNAVESNWLVETPRPTGRKVKFIFVGRYEYRKGFEELYGALKAISKAVPDTFEVKIVGPIPPSAQIDLPELTYTGFVEDAEQIKAHLDGADVLILSSHAEGLPTVIIEAMSRGLAIIATDVGAVKDLVSEENGWLIKPRSTDALEVAIAACLRMPPHQLDLRKEASLEKVAHKFTWDAVVKETITQLTAII